MTKTDAREIKSALLRLPKNRNKNPKTRNVPLSAVLDMPGLDRIAGRTVNVYLGHMQHFFGWAANNG
ncbi:MAG: integrase, partial [Pseudomonadota bacterium]